MAHGIGDAGRLGAAGSIPSWLGVIGALVFLGVLVAHMRHVLMSSALPRRSWHWGHVVMAASMIAMYLPASLDPLHIPAAGWRVAFILALVALAACGAHALANEHRAVSGLWLLLAGDMAAMLYMWSPGAYTAPVSAVIGGFLLSEAGLWASDRVVSLDRPLGPSLHVLVGSGVLGFARGDAGTVGSMPRELRISMVAMALGMASMMLTLALGT